MGIKNLKELIKNMQPEIDGMDFIFCTSNKKIDINFIMVFKEREGFTYILKEQEAKRNNLNYNGIWSKIILNVNSDLNAIGFLAEITKVLAKRKISVNAVSAYHHDYLFVPSSKSEEALIILKDLSKSLK